MRKIFIPTFTIAISVMLSFVIFSNTDDTPKETGPCTINTKTLCDAKGYAAKTPLTVSYNAEGVIEKIDVQPNAETPDFFRRARTLLDKYIGTKATDNVKVDAITGATKSSKALIANMEAANKDWKKRH